MNSALTVNFRVVSYILRRYSWDENKNKKIESAGTQPETSMFTQPQKITASHYAEELELQKHSNAGMCTGHMT